jgi:hypothetical protein
VKRLRGCLGVVLIFGLGLIVGGFLGFAAGWVGFFHKVVKGGPVAVREVLFQRANDDLRLDFGQKEEVQALLRETSKELDEITAAVRPAVEEALGKAEQRMRALLKPTQRTKFDNFMNDARRKWQKTVPPAQPAEPPTLERPAAEPPK